MYHVPQPLLQQLDLESGVLIGEGGPLLHRENRRGLGGAATQ